MSVDGFSSTVIDNYTPCWACEPLCVCACVHALGQQEVTLRLTVNSHAAWLPVSQIKNKKEHLQTHTYADTHLHTHTHLHCDTAQNGQTEKLHVCGSLWLISTSDSTPCACWDFWISYCTSQLALCFGLKSTHTLAFQVRTQTDYTQF